MNIIDTYYSCWSKTLRENLPITKTIHLWRLLSRRQWHILKLHQILLYHNFNIIAFSINLKDGWLGYASSSDMLGESLPDLDSLLRSINRQWQSDIELNLMKTKIACFSFYYAILYGIWWLLFDGCCSSVHIKTLKCIMKSGE